jgi:hypothetical protein
MKKFVMFAALAAAIGIAPVHAAPVHKPAVHHRMKAVLTPDQIADKIAHWAAGQAVPDLQQALAMAKASNETVLAPCWQALLTFAQNVQTTSAANIANTTLKVHIATDIENLGVLEQALEPNGPLTVACAPAAQFFGQQTATFVGQIVTGVTSIIKLVPTIPGIL